MQNCIRQEVKLEQLRISNILTNIVISSTSSGIKVTSHENKPTQEYVQGFFATLKEKCKSFFLNQMGQQTGLTGQGGQQG